ncbi:hypothetical protein [Rhabdochlamydiaceae symbiont of Dictyostelium giganteum]|uniref:hypothetical protein n=1 Tax=Rhabdochlamydiaceae symbiont of Dictyostelium giganteum TaxID=3342349 RepID=UPI00384E3D3B
MNFSTISSFFSSVKTTTVSCCKNPKTIPAKVANFAGSVFNNISSKAKNNPKKAVVIALVGVVLFSNRAKIVKVAQKQFKAVKNSKFVASVKSFFSSSKTTPTV